MDAEPRVQFPSEYDALSIGIALYDAEDATIERTNDRFESLFGYTANELRETTPGRYTANTYRFSEAEFAGRLRDAARGEPQRFPWRIKRGDGELTWVRVSLSEWDRGGDAHVLAEVRDASDHYAASRRETLFWRVLRHNLRNEANKLVGYSGEILRETDRHSVRDAAEKARSTALDLGAVATSVKEIQQAAVQTETHRSCRSAADAVRDVVTVLEPVYPDAEFSVEERRPMWVHVDAAFDHAVRHALENAACHADVPDPAVEVTVCPSPNTGRVEIRVDDRNPYIPRIETDALDTFSELTSTRHGTGVGLFVMKWCIESLGGELTFERREPRGNRVRVYLPPRDRPSDEA
ncbi:MAG: PAS domain-containing sensor histidine kinase [Halorubrum sp.]